MCKKYIKWLEDKTDTCVIFFDFAKALDALNHEVLSIKLEAYILRFYLLSWIRNFLANRGQYTNFHGALSKITEVTHGVIQGSVLGSLLFIIYINDLSDCIKSAIVLICADDLKIAKKT